MVSLELRRGVGATAIITVPVGRTQLGGEERWTDINYYRVYQNIFSGQLDQYDPWDLDHRVRVNMNLVEREGEDQGKTFFRAFQGFLSLSSLGPGRGTIKVVPVLEEVMMMMMMMMMMKMIIIMIMMMPPR